MSFYSFYANNTRIIILCKGLKKGGFLYLKLNFFKENLFENAFDPIVIPLNHIAYSYEEQGSKLLP